VKNVSRSEVAKLVIKFWLFLIITITIMMLASEFMKFFSIRASWYYRHQQELVERKTRFYRQKHGF